MGWLHTMAGWGARLWELDRLAGEIEGARFAYTYARVLTGQEWAKCRQQQERRIERYNEIRFWRMRAKRPNLKFTGPKGPNRSDDDHQ